MHQQFDSVFPNNISDVGFSFRFLTRGAFTETSRGRRAVFAGNGHVTSVHGGYARVRRARAGYEGYSTSSSGSGGVWAVGRVAGARIALGRDGRLRRTSVHGGYAQGYA